MQLQTCIDIPVSPWPIRYADRLLSLGSCFSDHIAGKMEQYYLRIEANPFGPLYNPISIAHHMTDEVLLDKDVVMITFGTAWVYIDRKQGTGNREQGKGKREQGRGNREEAMLDAVVDNCQKRPTTDFIRYRLTVEDILQAWRPVLEKYPNKRFIFTVSPIRHKKDGLHENQISKAILLQAIDELIALHPQAAYFPSYEIMLDELRDYRFYADDLVHPSSLAVTYIWERFAETYLYEASTRAAMQELHQLYLDRSHRPLHPESREYQHFLGQLNEHIHQLQKRYPWIPN